jgi:hypothetical protein
VAWAHRDHSNYDHVHIIAAMDRWLERERDRCRDPLEAELARARHRDLEREH